MSSFFFFKQMKAYEMRISDWSSDVCSSDLKCDDDRDDGGDGGRQDDGCGRIAPVMEEAEHNERQRRADGKRQPCLRHLGRIEADGPCDMRKPCPAQQESEPRLPQAGRKGVAADCRPAENGRARV